MDGLQTLKALKAARPELQVIMLSGREHAQRSSKPSALAPPTTSSSPTIPKASAKSRSTRRSSRRSRRNRLVPELTDLRRQLSDDQSDAFIGWSDSPAMRQVALSSNRSPTAT